jgi:hypothetical protein
VWIFDFVDDRDIIQLDVQVLVDGFEGTADEYVILQFNGDLVLNERLEEAEEEHICDVLWIFCKTTMIKP